MQVTGFNVLETGLVKSSLERAVAKTILFTALEPLLATDEGKAKQAIAQLAKKSIPVILFSDRSRAEIEPVREQLGLTAPFIVEGGSAIFTPVENSPLKTPLGEHDGNYYLYELGCPYVQARAGLRVLANEISHPLKGFGDFTVQQLERSLGVSEERAHLAKAREFSEPFMTPKSVDLESLKQSAKDMGFEAVIRDDKDSRFSLLKGAEANLTGAAEAVIAAYGRAEDALRIGGIAISQEEIDALSTAEESFDWTGVLLSVQPDATTAWLDAVERWL